jgi:hypothetical protein
VRALPLALAERPAHLPHADPFAGTDLATIDSATLSALNTMREAAESAETDEFNTQIQAASGAAKDALSVGKIKNKVLKLVGEVQVLNIKVQPSRFLSSYPPLKPRVFRLPKRRPRASLRRPLRATLRASRRS